MKHSLLDIPASCARPSDLLIRNARIERETSRETPDPAVSAVAHLLAGRSNDLSSDAREQFPGQVRIGVRAVCWRQSDLDDWSEKRPSTH